MCTPLHPLPHTTRHIRCVCSCCKPHQSCLRMRSSFRTLTQEIIMNIGINYQLFAEDIIIYIGKCCGRKAHAVPSHEKLLFTKGNIIYIRKHCICKAHAVPKPPPRSPFPRCPLPRRTVLVQVLRILLHTYRQLLFT